VQEGVRASGRSARETREGWVEGRRDREGEGGGVGGWMDGGGRGGGEEEIDYLELNTPVSLRFSSRSFSSDIGLSVSVLLSSSCSLYLTCFSPYPTCPSARAIG
jgi:hypothetical protein